MVQWFIMQCILFCLVWLFLMSQLTAMVMLGRSVHLTTFFPGQAWPSTVLCAHTFPCNWQHPFLNQQEENDHRNYFMINLQENIGLGQDWTLNLWICSGPRYWLHYRAWPRGYKTFFMLNSTEHEISIAHKNYSTDKKRSFLLHVSQMLYLSCL